MPKVICINVPSLVYTLKGSNLIAEALQRQALELIKAQWELAKAVALAINSNQNLGNAQTFQNTGHNISQSTAIGTAELVYLIDERKVRTEMLRQLAAKD